jgi:S1-C subfamily serine protease
MNPSKKSDRKHFHCEMISAVFIAVCFFVAVSCAFGDDTDNFTKVRRACLFVESTVEEPSGHITKETGTGFVITSSGFALTANHVLQSPSAKVSVIVGSRYGDKLVATVVSVPGVQDAALIQLPDSHAPYQHVTFGDPGLLEVGSQLISAGFPLDSDLSIAAPGNLSSKSAQQGLWQISVPLNYGNSGGPVIDAAGDVVGMVRGGINGAQLMNFMIPLNLMAPLLTMADLTWPPWQASEASTGSAILPIPSLTSPPLKQTGKNCHEITVVSAGLPPTYTKETICE